MIVGRFDARRGLLGIRIRSGVFWRSLRSTKGRAEARRPRSAEWITRRFGIGCIASTTRDRRAWWTASRPGAVRRLTPEQLTTLAEIVETGPDPASDGVVRWRCIDLKAVIRERFGVGYHERSVSRLLHDLGFSHMSARPQHPEQDTGMLETFKETSR